MDNTSHCYVIDTFVHEALEFAYPKVGTVCKLPFISTFTFEAMVARNSILREVCKAQTKLKMAPLLQVFKFWRYNQKVRFSLMWGLQRRATFDFVIKRRILLTYHNVHVPTFSSLTP